MREIFEIQKPFERLLALQTEVDNLCDRPIMTSNGWTLAKFLFCLLWTETKSKSTDKNAQKNQASLRLSWPIKGLLHGQNENRFLLDQRGKPRAGQDRQPIRAQDLLHYAPKTFKSCFARMRFLAVGVTRIDSLCDWLINDKRASLS